MNPAVAQIVSVPDIHVEATVGCAPQLPWQLWVEYANHTGEYRQVRWTNAALETEQEEAALPVGSTYEVRGFIIGDNTTAHGYPVTAHVSVVDHQSSLPARKPVCEPLPLNKVTLDGDNRLTHNRDLDIRNLLSLNPLQQLYNYRDTYGLPTDGYPEADGWDSPTTKLKGHGTGHYLSALALAFASTADVALRDTLRSRIALMVNTMRQCQERTFVWSDSLGRYFEARDLAPEPELRRLKGTWADFDRYKQDYRHYGYGYLNAIPAQHCVLIEMYRAYNNEEWVWAPYYTVHKQLAGLIDIATYIDDPQLRQKALLIAKDMGLWVWNRLHYRTYVMQEGTQQQRRERPGNRYEMWNTYIAGEVGGMGEALARLSTMVSDPKEQLRLLEAATYFDSPAFFDPLAHNIDAIRTRHANQHIPMITGALRCFRAGAPLSSPEGDTIDSFLHSTAIEAPSGAVGGASGYYYQVASNFWNMVQGRYRYAMGGVGNQEKFRQPYTQMLSMVNNGSPTLNETCCAYNLAKLTRDLNCYTPDDARLMDYYERVLYNQLVGSVNPKRYQVVYQYPVGLDAPKEWGSETPQSTCCGGTGAENHVKYQEAAYFVSSPSAGEPTLWVCLYMPTTATWDALGITLQQQCQWPAERSTLRIVKGKGQFAMKLRVPYWATEGFDVRLNGRSIADSYQPCSYVEIPKRKWSKRDVVEVIMPFSNHVDYGPDKVEIADATPSSPLWMAAFMRGPLVMADTVARTWQEATVHSSQFIVHSYSQSEAAKPSTQSDDGAANYELCTMRSALPLRFAKNYELNMCPDYDTDQHATHYFRIDAPVAEPTIVDTLSLQQAMKMARSRIEAQQAWQAMAVKVPDYAPWAPHGFARLQAQYDEALKAIEAPSGAVGGASPSGAVGGASLTPAEAERLISALNTTLNTMCPGNLAEPEDMDELLQLLEQARQLPPSRELRRAIGYAEMVRNYVISGSGTKDMILRAVNGLKANH